MDIKNLVAEMKLSDAWLKEDFAKVLAHYNSNHDEYFFQNLIYSGVQGKILEPINNKVLIGIPPENRNYIFIPKVLIGWAKSKNLELPFDFEERMTVIEDTKCPEEGINNRLEKSYLNIIGALLKTLLSTSTGGKKISSFDNEAHIIRYLTDNFSSPGVSKRNLEKVFGRINKSFDSQQMVADETFN